MSHPPWTVDPNDPRAPAREIWDRMTKEEREQVLAALPAQVPLDLHPPEGDPHRVPKERARNALDEFFRTIGRRIYVSSELATYYPNESRFCPDILAVLDVDAHERSRWVTSHEGKGLDLVIEVHVGGCATKDFETNVLRYARLGIPEYFIFDRVGARILGYRLKANSSSYERIVPQAGRLTSNVLGLDLTLEGGMLRFYYGTAPVLFLEELVSKLNGMVGDLVEARDRALQRAEEQAQRAEEQAREIESLRAQLEQLRAR
ncbi:MAG TPA: Uma2 family endonuclease [Polyangiaceae bacterium]|nr:Uma2 family endonuclease [Polyangiaceae bacterium]